VVEGGGLESVPYYVTARSRGRVAEVRKRPNLEIGLYLFMAITTLESALRVGP